MAGLGATGAEARNAKDNVCLTGDSTAGLGAPGAEARSAKDNVSDQ